MDDHIIRFGDGGRWRMIIDLKELAGSMRHPEESGRG